MIRMPMRKSLFSPFRMPRVFKILTLLLLSGFSILSLISFDLTLSFDKNWIGTFGGALSYSLVYLFGIAALMIPGFLCWLIFQLILGEIDSKIKRKSVYFLIFLVSLNLILSIPDTIHALPDYLNNKIFRYKTHYCLGGVPFHIIYSGQSSVRSSLSLKKLLGELGSICLFSSFCITSLIYFIEPKPINWSGIKQINIKKYFKNKEKIKNLIIKIKKKISKNQYFPKTDCIKTIGSEKSPKSEPILKTKSPLNSSASDNPPHPQNRLPYSPEMLQIKDSKNTTVSQFRNSTTPLPLHTLLSKNNAPDISSNKAFLEKQAIILKETLAKFGIEVGLGAICSGPTLTAFEVLPQAGVKVQKIKALESDIALNLQASSIRIIAPIPGKAAVGIEIPNPRPQSVEFRELLENYLKQSQKLQIPLLLGKKANGDNLWTDLASMPHLIIAGTTGSGKSVCINTIIMSIIMTSFPSDIRLMIIDPKKVELTGYSKLPHMLSPVITEGYAAHNALTWLVKEMERRYEILRRLGLRNIQSFNARQLSQEDLEEHPDIPKKFPFIVGIIDELADLLLSSSQDMETPIIRIAQMARAVGIHMILATQRPSREVITGLIKANFPSRISFKVSNRVNSQIIIDEPGAENLMGNGDMLLLAPNHFGTIRAQGAYVRDEDINKIIKDLCSKMPLEYIIPSFERSFEEVKDPSSSDPLFREATGIVLSTGNASTTFLQRKLRIGYARAASLMDQLESAGIIGPSEGAKPRKIIGRLNEN